MKVSVLGMREGKEYRFRGYTYRLVGYDIECFDNSGGIWVLAKGDYNLNEKIFELIEPPKKKVSAWKYLAKQMEDRIDPHVLIDDLRHWLGYIAENIDENGEVEVE